MSDTAREEETGVLGLTLDELLTTTRSVRKRLDFDRKVPRKQIEECLTIAAQAPNGSNLQLWQWLVVDERETVAEIARLYNEAVAEYAKVYAADTSRLGAAPAPGFDRMTESVMYLAQNLHRAPALVIPCMVGRMEQLDTFQQASLWGSILPAAWSFMLALRSRGLGSAWTTVHLHREKEVAGLLGIPAHYTQAGLFPVAHTLGTEFKPAPRKPLSEVLHWNHW